MSKQLIKFRNNIRSFFLSRKAPYLIICPKEKKIPHRTPTAYIMQIYSSIKIDQVCLTNDVITVKTIHPEIEKHYTVIGNDRNVIIKMSVNDNTKRITIN